MSIMDIIIHPINKLEGELSAPPSKSYTHRYLFTSLLAEGESILINPLKCNDTEASLEAIRAFGAKGGWSIIRSNGELETPRNAVDCRRSGTTCRFATALAALVSGPTTIIGSTQLMKRPMKDLIVALKHMGIEVLSNNYRLPIVIRGGRIKVKQVGISGKVSSQFVSALILLGSRIGIEIFVEDELVSKGYVDMTLKVLKEVGIGYYRDGYKYFNIIPGHINNGVYVMPGDYSSASYFIAAAAIGGKIKIRGLEREDVQPDRKILWIVREMGAHVSWRNDELEVCPGELEGVEVDCRDMPDLLPIVSILGAYAKGKTVVYGVKHARYKETDRIKTTVANLRKMGIKTEESKDGLVIYGGEKRNAVFNSYGDHRIAMAFIIASLFLDKYSKVLDVDVIRDSYPSFFESLKIVGGRFRLA